MPMEATLYALGLVERELLLFAAVWFVIGAADDLGIDMLWLWLRLSGRARTGRLEGPADQPLRGIAAVLVPAWREQDVVGAMIRHSLDAWPHAEMRFYVGCYRNDPATLAAAIASTRDDRLRIVVHDRDGPTTKADCLNRLYEAMCEDERRGRFRVRSVILHDAEDMVHPAALSLLDSALDEADFVQLPVRPEPQRTSRWIGGHYCDEFAEAHGKVMVVRDWLGAGLPAAGVGCAFSRTALETVAARRGASQPFAPECLTEDYECGLLIGEEGGRSRFLRVRDARGDLVATREFFPARLDQAVRQKTRWMHGIAFQGWDRLGWRLRPAELWMRLRDRRGPLDALVLLSAYVLLVLAPVLMIGRALGYYEPVPLGHVLRWLIGVNAFLLGWRLLVRGVFTAREYDLAEGVRAVLRAPVSNVIAIMAGRRALMAYLASLRHGQTAWDHTSHHDHPALATRI